MKRCPKCGEKLMNGFQNCPNCNEPLTGPEAKRGAGNKALGIGAAIVVAAVALVFGIRAIIGGGGPGGGSPEKDFVNYQQELLLGGVMTEYEQVLDQFGSGEFSSDLTFSLAMGGSQYNTYLNGSSVVLKADMNQKHSILNAELNLMGSPVLSGTLTYESGVLGLYLPEGDQNYYVMDLNQVLTRYGYDEVDWSALQMPEFSGKEWRSLFESYLELVYTVVTKDSVQLEKNQEYTLPGLNERYTGNVYTFTPTAKDVEAMVLKLADKLEQDQTLRKLILELYNVQALEAAFGSYMTQGMSLEEELDEAFQEAAQELRDDAAEMAQDIEDAGLIWTLYTQGKEVRMIVITARGSDSQIVWERTGSDNGQRVDLFYGEDGDGDYAFSIKNTFEKKGSTYTGTVELVGDYSSDVMSCSYSIDTSKRSPLGAYYGTYELMVEGYEDVSIKLETKKGEQGGTDHVITVAGDPSVFDYQCDSVTLTINATDKSTAQKPSAAPVDISAYTEQELEVLAGQIGSKLYTSVVASLMPMFYGR